MKRTITIASVITLVSLLALPSLSLAQIPPASGDTTVPVPTGSAFATMNRLMTWLYTILLVVAVIVILIAAYLFITAAGNPETLGKARGMVLYAVIAIILAAIAWGIVGIVRKITEG